MVEVPPHRPPPSDPRLGPALATATYLAVLVAAWGLTSLALNREVIDYVDAGPLLGPTIAATACAVLFVALWRARTRSVTALLALGVVVACFVAMVVVGALGYTVTRGDPGWLPIAAAHFALSPFVLGAAALAGIVALGGQVARSFDRRSR